jgi:asparagine synthase (glutamine-hydrolysing)
MYADKLSMAHGLEVRVPYLDKEVVEFAERLPARFKVRGGHRKWLHKKVCEGFLPPAILARKKRGFGVNVVDEWFSKSLDTRMGRYLQDTDSLMFQF